MSGRAIFHLHESAEIAFGYAQAVRIGETVYVAGTTAMANDLSVRFAGDLPEQLRVIYRHLRTTLEAFGLGFRHVVRETIYTTDMDALVASNDLRRAFLDPAHLPVTTAVQVERLVLPGLMLEVELLARADLDTRAPVRRVEAGS